jgi:hypothetical protein
VPRHVSLSQNNSVAEQLQNKKDFLKKLTGPNMLEVIVVVRGRGHGRRHHRPT